MCYNVIIVDDDICEAPSENFLAQLTVLHGGTYDLLFIVTEIVIIDSTEPECGKQALVTFTLIVVVLWSFKKDCEARLKYCGSIAFLVVHFLKFLITMENISY